MDGTRCAEPGCRQHDFLPFDCGLCGESYCLEHRSRFVHSCAAMIDQQQHQPPLNFNQDPHRESVKSMMDRVENRFQPQQLSTYSSSTLGNSGYGSSREHYNIKSSSMVPSHTASHSRAADRMAALAAASAHMNSKQRSISNKTREMLMKSKAVGNPSIAVEDRFYLAVHFTDQIAHLPSQSQRSQQQQQQQHHHTVFLYFNKNSTVGELLQQIWRSHSELVQRSATFRADFSIANLRLEELLLVMCTADTPDWRSWDRNSSVQRCLSSCEDVAVFAVPMQDAIRNQRDLETIKLSRPSLSPGKRSERHQLVPSPPKSAPPPSIDAAVAADSASAAGGTVTALSLVQAAEYEKGQCAWYHRIPKSDLEVARFSSAAEAVQLLPLLQVRIVGVHHDDFPNIYYTVQLIQPLRLSAGAVQKHGAAGEGLIFEHEKQTDKLHLLPLINSGDSSSRSKSSSSSNNNNTNSTAAAIRELKDSLLRLGSPISIKATYRKKEISDIRIGSRSSVSQLKLLLGALFEIPVPDMKLICKGAILKDNHQLLKDTKIANGSKVLVVSGTPQSAEDAWG